MSDPNDAPVGRQKWFPSVGFRGDVNVNPRRLRLVAARMVKIVNFVVVELGDEDDGDEDEDEDEDEEVMSPLSECKS